MRIGVVGSRGIKDIDIEKYIGECNEIVSGGACGIDTLAEKYANEKGLRLTVFLPEYEKYGRAAPIVRNKKIVDYSDKIIAFWDGRSRGTFSVISYAKKAGKICEVILVNN